MIEISFFGNIGLDAISRQVNDKKYLTFSVAVKDRYNSKKGEKIEKVTWVDCIMSHSDVMSKYLLKGTKVWVRGRMSIQEFEARDGKRIGIGCSVDKIELCSYKDK